MFASKESNSIRLIDFGFASVGKLVGKFLNLLDSPIYLSP